MLKKTQRSRFRKRHYYFCCLINQQPISAAMMQMLESKRASRTCTSDLAEEGLRILHTALQLHGIIFHIHSRHVVSTTLSTPSAHESTKLQREISELSFSNSTSHQIFSFQTAKSPYPVGQKAALRRVSRQLTSISVPVMCFHRLVMGFLILSRPRWSSWITSR